MKIIKLLLVISLWFQSISYANEKIIYIYNDEGVSKESLEQTIHSFSKQHIVKTINAQDIKKGAWTKNADLLIIPGGADLPYAKKLNGLGNQVIKDYVKNGGSLLGICAGAYYSSGFVEFDMGGELEVVGPRELQFFPGKAIGPALAKYEYKNNSGARAANIKIDNKNVRIYFNGGAYFDNADKMTNILVIGTYDINKPAIIYTKYGTGNVVLSGVHFEYDPALLNSKDKYIATLLPGLVASDKDRIELINKVSKLLNIQP